MTHRTFLVVVDDTEEMRSALRFACNRARNTGGQVALLHVADPVDFEHFASIGNLMREEARAEAEQLMQRLASDVHTISGQMPVIYMRDGNRREEVIKLIDEEPTISILVLAAGTSKEGPGPLVSALAGKMSGKLRVPITVVPGSLSDEEIDRLT